MVLIRLWGENSPSSQFLLPFLCRYQLLPAHCGTRENHTWPVRAAVFASSPGQVSTGGSGEVELCIHLSNVCKAMLPRQSFSVAVQASGIFISISPDRVMDKFLQAGFHKPCFSMASRRGHWPDGPPFIPEVSQSFHHSPVQCLYDGHIWSMDHRLSSQQVREGLAQMGVVRVCRGGTSSELWELQFLSSVAFFSLCLDFLGMCPDSQHVHRCTVCLASH